MKLKNTFFFATLLSLFSLMSSFSLAGGDAGAGRHYLMVKTTYGVQCIRVHFYTGSYWTDRAVDVYIAGGWKSTGVRLFDNQPMFIKVYGESACLTSSLIGYKDGGTVPNDSLTNYWLDATSGVVY